MSTLRNSLTCLLLAVSAVAAGKSCLFLDQVSIVVADGQSVIAQAGPQLIGASIEMRGAAQELRETISEIRATSSEMRAAWREQRTYYKATGKALAIDMVQAGRLIEHADAAIQQFDTSRLIQDGDALLKHAGDQIDANGEALRLTLAAARGNFEQSEKLWPPLVKSAASLAAAGDNVQGATESIRIALEPLRKPTGRLKLVLRWLLQLPHISIP